MVKSELIENLAAKADLPTSHAENFVNAFFDVMTDSLVGEGRVEIRGFGALTVRKYPRYSGRNPKTGEKIDVSEKQMPFWKTGLELKQRVNGLD
jgi:integration host factor subunit beta